MRAVVALTALAAASSALAFPTQIPFGASSSRSSVTSNGPVRIEQEEDFTTFKHESFPSHAVRAVQPRGFCDSTVQQWSGYLDTPNNRHFYFWFFESRNDPVNDPVILWLNGGPGCSSFTGLVMELGPCRVTPPNKHGEVIVEENPWSWNNNASIIFLDQPVGVGYSYAEKGDKGVWTTETAAEDVHALLQIWFNAFDKDFGTNDFHIAGESFAGRYIPVFSDYIVQQNKKENGLRKINLKSVLIGNGMTNTLIQYGHYYTAACTNQTGYGPYLTPEVCDKMLSQLPKCQALFQKCYDDPSDSIVCLSATTFCEATQTEPFYQTGRNAYDMEKFGDFAEEDWMHDFLNQKSTFEHLGVDKLSHGRVHKHTGCDPTVGYRFSATGDGAKPTFPHVASILENGVAALLYSGERDFICNWVGGGIYEGKLTDKAWVSIAFSLQQNQEWVEKLEWSGHDGFAQTTLTPWHAAQGSQAVAGKYRTYQNLTFATVADCGHFVPTTKPIESLAMFNAWIHTGPSAFKEVLARQDSS